MKLNTVCVAHRELQQQSRGVSLVEKEVFDTVREEEAGGSVETTPAQTATNTEPTELRQRAGPCRDKE